MLALMAVNPDEDAVPLYVHTIKRILRDLRVEQQQTGGSFNYAEFKRRITSADITGQQMAPLNQRLDTLESFMPQSQTGATGASKAKKQRKGGNDWSIQVRRHGNMNSMHSL
jgi:hypothetical protein